MITTAEALKDWDREGSHYSLKLGDGLEINLEPLLWDNQWYLAIYKDQSLVVPKICIKPGYVKEEEENNEKTN